MTTLEGRVLVVDDDRLNRIKLSVNLEEIGCIVSLAENGAQAMEMLCSQPFDTVLLDLLMPVMDGFVVLEQLQADKDLCRIPVIVISAEDDLASVVSCIEKGATDYLSKPFNATLLRARIGACLEKKRAHDREAELFAELQLRYRELEDLNAKIREQAAQLQELSARDALTGLYNRRYFDEHVAQTFAHAQRYAQPLSVMIGDIDFFKRINDQFSHAIGDEVLRHVARLMQSNTRDSDIVARYGGEEFVLALPATSLTSAAALCEKLRATIENYAWQQIHPALHVTMSMGLSADIELGSFDKMIAAADAQLYRAKSGGRNRVCAGD